MKLFNFKSVNLRILSGFILIMVLVICFTTFNYSSNSSSSEKLSSMKNQQTVQEATEAIANSLLVRSSAASNYVLTGEKSFKNEYKKMVNIVDEKVTLLNKIDKEGMKERMSYVERGRNWHNEVQKQVFDEYDAGNKKQAIANLTTLNKEEVIVRSNYEKLADDTIKASDQLSNSLIETSLILKNTGAAISICIIILGVLIALVTAKSIVHPIKIISQRMHEIAEGNISQEKINTTRKDELGNLLQITNTLTEKLNSSMTAIQLVSERVAANSEELAQSTNEVSSGSEQIAQTMHEIAEGADMQARKTTDLAEQMIEFKERVHAAATEGQSLSTASNDVQTLTKSGQLIMKDTTEQMHVIDTIVAQAVERVESLNKQSAQISTLVSVINDIAGQTNLLALNAAIEAARAGEHGKGFAVVADEVGKLANQVQNSVADISHIVRMIQSETSEVTSSLNTGYTEVQKGTQQMVSTNDTFTYISTAVHDMSNTIHFISSNLSSISDQTTTIAMTVNDIAAVTEQSAAGVQQTSATIEETTSTMEDMSSSTEQLAAMAEELNGEVHKFKLS
ncbi:methyl-accepting chemotaxis protein [Kurthia sibirica]|uniref:methyl-accepting chemotaxis protein n=1 Tax=Kurthia sibirica TaxID=202750 RepID=UPI00116640B4|nr:methyl-accepting chemotaxis protein [Kurthia sibirica]GEK34193.1 putative sensory transducer protein YvaQ [Kurthia sibirica]